MSIESAIVALLDADSGAGGVAAVLTGGIYGYDEIGKKGLDPDNAVTASAFTNTNGFEQLQPCCVVKVRTEVPDGSRYDRATQVTGLSGVVEFWLYDENNYTTIKTARAAIYSLLQSTTNANIGILELVSRISGLRDEALNDAALLRDDYLFVTTLSSS